MQKRHNLTVAAATSNCKMSPEEYILKRPTYLKREREFRRAIGVILPRPAGYSQYHEEIWEDEEFEKWDAERELNLDEVPFTLDIGDTRQLCAEGERKSVVAKGMKHTTKYRQGTLVLVSNYKKILLTVVIFNKGGPRVAQLLENLSGTIRDSDVVWECSESGSMTTWIWKKTMNCLKNKTKHMRGCLSMDGFDWNKGVVLNIDNFTVHLDADVAKEYAFKYGIFVRCLIKNASHLQQPIDQHVGIFVKNRMKQKMEKWVVDNQRMASIGEELTCTKQKWREVVAKFVKETLDEIHADKKKHVLVLAWENYGLFLNLDGSQDGDILTLHKDADREPSKHRQKRTDTYRKKVTIRKRNIKQPIGQRIYPYIQGNFYSMNKAARNSTISINTSSQQVSQLKQDLTATNHKLVTKFKKQFQKDLTNQKNILPDLNNIITPYDIMTLRKMYLKYKGRKKTDKIFAKKLGLPIRNNQGQLIYMPPAQSMDICDDKSDAMDIDQQQTAPYNTPFVLQVLDFMDLDFHSQGAMEHVVPTQNKLITEQQLQKMAIEQQMQIAISMNDADNKQLQNELVTIAGWSGLVPGGRVRESMVRAANWARKWGGAIGETQRSYRMWHECWETMCGKSGAMSQLHVTEEQLDIDLWAWLNDKLYDVQSNNRRLNVKIGGNSGLRCWFLAVLYLLVGENNFMQLLKQKRGDSYGHRLLHKLLQSLKIAITQQKVRALEIVTQFIEALLQGHYCYWEDYGCLETSFRILERMAPEFFKNFAVQFQIWSNCSKHGEYKTKTLKALRLELNYETKWSYTTGYLSYRQPRKYKCFETTRQGVLCSTETNKRFCKVLTPINQSFMIHFEHGVPATLWNQIMSGHCIFFGQDMREIGGAIFRTNQNHFVAAYLMVNHSETPQTKPKIWYKVETLSEKMVKYTNAKAEDCRIIFINPPEKSCFCKQYDDLDMLECSKCNHWLHKRCINVPNRANTWDDSTCPICNNN